MKYKKSNETENDNCYVQLCLAKVSALDAQRCLMVDSYWSNIALKDPLLVYT